MKLFKKITLSMVPACIISACLGVASLIKPSQQEVVAESINLITNGDFSSADTSIGVGGASWNHNSWKPGTATFEVTDDTDENYGAGKLKLTVPVDTPAADKDVYVQTSLNSPLQAGVTYQLSADIAVTTDKDALRTTGDCGFYLDIYDGANGILSLGYEGTGTRWSDIRLDGKVEMSHFQRMFTVPTTGEYYVSARIWGHTGTMYVDNVSLTAVDEATGHEVGDRNFASDALYGVWNRGWMGNASIDKGQTPATHVRALESHIADGSGSLCISNPADTNDAGAVINGNSYLGTDVYLIADTTYSLSGWIKAGSDLSVYQSAATTHGARFGVRDIPPAGQSEKYLVYCGANGFTGSVVEKKPEYCNWTYYEQEFTVPTTGHYYLTCAIWGATGSAYFDDVRLAKKTIANEDVKLDFKAANLALHDTIYIQYAVDVSANVNISDVQVLVWRDTPTKYKFGTHDTAISYDSTKVIEIGEKTYPIFAYTDISFKEIAEPVYACVYVNIDGVSYYGETIKYSVLQYAYNKLGLTDATPTQNDYLKEMLNYILQMGASIQKYVLYKTDTLPTDNWTYVKVANGVFEDGFESGLYKAGTKVRIIANQGYTLSEDVPEYITVEGGNIYLTVPDIPNNPASPEDLTWADLTNIFVQ